MGFGDFFKGLFGEVGNGRENREDDVKQVKRGLGSLAYRDDEDEPSGYIDRSTDRGIRDFQEDEGLRVDGWMRPGGPTEDALTSRLGTADRLRYPDLRVKRTKRWEDLGWGGPRGAFGVPTLTTEEDRIDNILADRPARFEIEDDEDADPGPEPHQLDILGTNAVRGYDDIIEREAKKRKVDPDLVRSVMWAENARGHKFGGNQLADAIGTSHSKLPMNIQTRWGRLVGAQPDDMTKPEVNIAAGTELLKRLSDRIERPTVAKIGSLWHGTGQERVDDLGADIARVYREKPWLLRDPFRGVEF